MAGHSAPCDSPNAESHKTGQAHRFHLDQSARVVESRQYS